MDFEAHPVGTAQKILDMEMEIAVFRAAEQKVTDPISDEVAPAIKALEQA